jgi:bifunctional DNA-binding transcriptional regulator/antitoxin component of YhaV-PrlF toxin-antitoxin module
MPTLTFRKLIRFGADGLVVTIPKSWVRYYGLKAGDQLQVIADSELIIRVVKAETRENGQAQ